MLKFKDETRELAFHGTNATNILGVFAKGLQVAPLEAHQHGAVHGSGVYLTDNSTVACQDSSDDIKTVFLCEIAPGKQFIYQADFAEMDETIMNDFDSTYV